MNAMFGKLLVTVTFVASTMVGEPAAHAVTAGTLIVTVDYSDGLGVNPAPRTFTMKAAFLYGYMVSDTPVGVTETARCWFSGTGIDGLAVGAGTFSGGCTSAFQPSLSCATGTYQRIGTEMVLDTTCLVAAALHQPFHAVVNLAPVARTATGVGIFTLA